VDFPFSRDEQESYTPLYSNNRRFILNSSGTRSPIVDEFGKLLETASPDKNWILKESKPLPKGWYQAIYLSVRKSDTNNFNVKFDKSVYRFFKRTDNSWDVVEEI